jgi:hypothetical protein
VSSSCQQKRAAAELRAVPRHASRISLYRLRPQRSSCRRRLPPPPPAHALIYPRGAHGEEIAKSVCFQMLVAHHDALQEECEHLATSE